MAVLAGNTKSTIAFFSNFGSAYVASIDDMPASTGYGDPVQKLFKFGDGERVVSALSMDPRVKPRRGEPAGGVEERLRAALRARAAPRGVDARRAQASPRSPRATRSSACARRPTTACSSSPRPTRTRSCATSTRSNVLANPGRGVTVIKTDEGDRRASASPSTSTLALESEKGKTAEVKPLKKDRVPRGSKGTAGLVAQREGRAHRAAAADGAAARRRRKAAKSETSKELDGRAQVHRTRTSPSSKGSSRSASAPACTSAASTRAATTTCCGRSSTTRSTR